MWPYVLLIIVPIAIQHLKITKNKTLCISTNNNKRNALAMKTFWIMLFLLVVLRHESIGTDTKAYAYIFDYISKNNWETAIWRSEEIGFNLLNKIISEYIGDFRWVIIVSGIIGIYFVAKTYIKYSNDTALTIAIFITISNFVLLFSGMRQAIAISIGFVAFECVRNKKVVSFIMLVVIAMLFHTSAFMIAFLYPLYYIKFTKNRLVFIIPLLICVFVFNKQIFGFLGAILMQFTEYNAEISLTGAITMLILFSLFAVFSYVIPDENKLDDDTLAMRNYLLFAVALQMFAPLHTLAMRMNYYFIIFIPILLPRIIQARSRRWNQVAILARNIMIVFFVIYFLITAPADNVLDTFPYRFLWENV